METDGTQLPATSTSAGITKLSSAMERENLLTLYEATGGHLKQALAMYASAFPGEPVPNYTQAVSWVKDAKDAKATARAVRDQKGRDEWIDMRAHAMEQMQASDKGFDAQQWTLAAATAEDKMSKLDGDPQAGEWDWAGLIEGLNRVRFGPASAVEAQTTQQIEGPADQ